MTNNIARMLAFCSSTGAKIAIAMSLILPATLPSEAATPPAVLLTIGSGSVGGVYYPAAGALCRLLNLERARHAIRCQVELTGGSVQNVQDILANRADFGLVQTDVQAEAVTATGRFSLAKKQPGLRALFTVHAEPFTLIARLDSGISTFADLRGRRVNVGRPKSGTRASMTQLMRAHGLVPSDFAGVFELSPQSAGTALCQNRIDAFVYVVGHPNRTIRGVSETCAVKIVPIVGPAVERLLQGYAYYSATEIAPRVYLGNERSVSTVGVRAAVLTTVEMSETLAYELTRSVFENLPALRALHPAFRNLTVAQMLSGNTAPYHRGAIRYFKEANIPVPAGG